MTLIMRIFIFGFWHLSIYLVVTSAALYTMENYSIDVQEKKSVEQRLFEMNQILLDKNKTNQEIQIEQLSYIIKEFPTKEEVNISALYRGEEDCSHLRKITLMEAYEKIQKSSWDIKEKILAFRQVVTHFGCLELALKWSTKEALQVDPMNREPAKNLCKIFASIKPKHQNFPTFYIHEKASRKVARWGDEDMIDFFMELYTHDLYILESLCENRGGKLGWFFEKYFMGKNNQDKTVKKRDGRRIITLLEKCGFLNRGAET